MGASTAARADRRAPSVRVVPLLAALLLAACQPAPSARATGPVATPTPQLPNDIVRGLQTDARVLECPQGLRQGRSAFAADWVRSRRVDLDADGREDWLVEGVHPCLRRDGLADWWIYAEGDGGRRLIGHVRDARSLEVLPASGPGHAGLRVRTAEGERILRYRGYSY